jgi:hypothetical protein
MNVGVETLPPLPPTQNNLRDLGNKTPLHQAPLSLLTLDLGSVPTSALLRCHALPSALALLNQVALDRPILSYLDLSPIRWKIRATAPGGRSLTLD